MVASKHSYLLPSIPIDESGRSTRIVRKGILLLVFTLGIGALWSAFAPLSGAVIASGIIRIDTHRKTVQHLNGGIVRKILVREGSLVNLGQPLITLEDVTSSASLQILRDQLNALLVKEARLDAERGLKTSIAFPSDLVRQTEPKVVKLLTNEKAVFTAKRNALDEEIELLNKAIEEARSAESGLLSQIAAIQESMSFVSKRLKATEKLQARNFVSDMDVNGIQQSLSEKNETLGGAKAALAQAREKIADSKLKITTLRHDYIKEADIEFQETKKQIFEIEERVRPAEDTQNRQVITAPIKGQVIDLKVTTIGGVIKEGEPLMDIVPENSPLIVEAKVNPDDIESVHLGQTADIQLDAYNRRTTPLLNGSVVYVSGDSIDDPVKNEQFYLAHIEVQQESLRKLGAILLAPGMPATTFLKTESRTFFEYLLSPLLDHARRAFRES